jgi:RNA polymerase sigma-70 factor (ECF subfamily)
MTPGEELKFMTGPTNEEKLLELLRAGDETLAHKIFNAYAGQLLSLARLRISQQMARRIDPEDVVQSAFRTFFRRVKEGNFTIEGLDDVSKILVSITVHKALRQVAFQRAAKRDPGRETDASSGMGDSQEPPTLEPSPDATVAFLDHLEHFLSRLKPTDRSIVELRLQGYSNEEISQQFDLSDRHVRRVLQHVRSIAEQERQFTLD